MKKILFLLLVIPFCGFAQKANIIDLTEYGLSATINLSDYSEVESIENVENTNKVLQIKITLTNGEKIKLIEIKAPHNYSEVKKSALDQVAKSKSKARLILNTGKDLIIESMNYYDEKQYSVMTNTTFKKMQLLTGCEVKTDEKAAKKMLGILKTFQPKP